MPENWMRNNLVTENVEEHNQGSKPHPHRLHTLSGSYLDDAALWETASKRNIKCQGSRWNAFSTETEPISASVVLARRVDIGDTAARMV